jgi:hypothetical protein
MEKLMTEMTVWSSELLGIPGHGFLIQMEDLAALLDRVASILKVREDLKDTTGGDVHGVSDTNTGKAQLVECFDRVNRSHDHTQHFNRMLQAYDQSSISIDTLWNIAWRLAAGRDEMVADRGLAPGIPGIGQPDDFWEGLFIESCRYGPPTRKGKLQLTLSFRIMGGKYAGLRFEQNITYFMVVSKIAKEIGFPRYRNTHYNELVKCVFIGHVMLEAWGDRLMPRVSEYHVTSVVKKLNMDIRKERSKSCRYAGYTWPCHRCFRGYVDDGLAKCDNAVRPRALVAKLCSKCGKESFFDLDSGSQVCVGCQAAPYRLLDRR